MVAKNGFVFNTPEGQRVGEAKNFTEFKKMVKGAPLSSVVFHAKRGDFTSWLKYIGRKEIASRVKRIKGKGEEVRTEMMAILYFHKTTKKRKAKK